MKSLTTLSLYICMSAASASAAQYEFAFLSFPDGGIRWIDKAGAREAGKGQLATEVFAELSGQDPKLSRSAQYKVLVLNGLSRSGWELVQVNDAAVEPTYLLKRDLSGAKAGAVTPAQGAKSEAPKAEGKKIPITFTGGHDIDPRDGGRPVVLIAAALNVPAEVFRETFTHVTPAAGGREPEPAQVRRNKEALLRGLEPHGVTNERLDAVSNFYRYNGSRGQIWRNTPATASATVGNGVVTAVTITNPGAGYSSPPKLSIPGVDGVELKTTLSFGADLDTNGSIKEIAIVP
jgi:hypothetical protein